MNCYSGLLIEVSLTYFITGKYAIVAKRTEIYICICTPSSLSFIPLTLPDPPATYPPPYHHTHL